MRRLIATAVERVFWYLPLWCRMRLRKVVYWVAPKDNCFCGSVRVPDDPVFGMWCEPQSTGWLLHSATECEFRERGVRA